MADRCVVVPQVGVAQRAGSLEEEQVVPLAVVGEPAVPDPVLGTSKRRGDLPDDGAIDRRARAWARKNSEISRPTTPTTIRMIPTVVISSPETFASTAK